MNDAQLIERLLLALRDIRAAVEDRTVGKSDPETLRSIHQIADRAITAAQLFHNNASEGLL